MPLYEYELCEGDCKGCGGKFTLRRPLETADLKTKESLKAAYERSDICVVPAAGVAGESMVSLVLAKAFAEKFAGDSLEETRRNELQYTLSEQRRLISTAVEPILVAVYQEKGCGILIDRESVFIMNPAMDLTATVIERLNTTLPSLSFNRMPVPVQQGQ